MTQPSEEIRSDSKDIGPTEVSTPVAKERHPEGPDSLGLKWGTLKAWDLKSDAARAAAQKYLDIGNHSLSAMHQRDTDEQIEAMCALIDAIDGTIYNDWSGEDMTPEEAKAYVREYQHPKATGAS